MKSSLIGFIGFLLLGGWLVVNGAMEIFGLPRDRVLAIILAIVALTSGILIIMSLFT